MTNLQLANLALAHVGSTRATALNDGTKEGNAVGEYLDDSRKAVLRMHPWNFATKRDTLTITYVTVTSAANNGAGLVRLTALAHGKVTGDWIGVKDVAGTTEANGTWKVTRITDDVLDLQGSAYSNTFTGDGKLWLAPAFDFTYAIPLPSDFLRVLAVDDGDTDYDVESGFLITDEESVEFRYVWDVTDYAKLSKDPLFMEMFALYLAWKISFHITDSLDKREELFEAFKLLKSRSKSIDSKESPSREFISDDWLGARQGRGRFVRDPMT